MAKTQHQRPEDDWAGLAQNLFGINLDKPASGDDDLLDEDMFKVVIPKPPIAQAEVEFTPTEAVAPVTPRPAPVVVARPTPTPAPAPIPAKAPAAPKRKAPETVSADSFGAGLEAFGIGIDETTSTDVIADEADDDGLTLPEDYDAEGLTLPADYDDGLTLAPEFVTATADDQFETEFSAAESDDDLEEEDEDEEDEDEEDEIGVDESEVEAVGETAAGETAAPGQPRGPRRPRRTREDAYWDMLENWEWEEIPVTDAPRAEGTGSRFGRDRGGKPTSSRGRDDRSRRTERPRDDQAKTERPPRTEDRPRPAERPREETRTRDERPRTESRPRPEERSATGAPPRSRPAEGPPDRPRSAGRGDRPREDRPREEKRRDEPQPAVVIAPRVPQPTPSASDDFGDFGSGIFDETSLPAARTNRGPENDVAQSSQAADKVLPRSAAKRPHTATSRPVEEELVWPEEDDSDVRLVPTDSVVETSAFPSAEADDESDEVPASGVSEVESSEGPRPRRRRRRRGGRRPESAAAATDEGTTFDLNEVLDEPGDTADFIPASASEDSAVNDDESESEEGADVSDSDEGRPSERRGRRRRRRRRPDSVGAETDSTPAAEGTFSDEPPLATTTDLDDVDEEDEDEDEVVPVITYAKMPSWEEAIRFLLNPHLVGRNLEPEDEGESLIGDPRGSGGSEPTPPASAQRRYRRSGGGGGGGRGRR